MKPEEQRIAIAEACGWRFWTIEGETLLLRPEATWLSHPHWQKRGAVEGDGRPHAPLTDISLVPDYLNDLNAMHEAEHWLFTHPEYSGDAMFAKYNDWLFKLRDIYRNHPTIAKAPQRAEAFLRTIDKWKETE